MRTPEPDKEILRLAQRGDKTSFARIVEHTKSAVFNLSFRMCASREEAEDLAQEIFLHLYRNIGMFDLSRPFMPWLYKVSANFIANHLKKRRVQTVSLDLLGKNDSGGREADVEDIKSRDIQDAAEKEKSEILREATASLPENYRIVIVLRYLEDMEVSEIAKILDIPAGTVKTWLFRARETLYSKLKNIFET